MDLNGIKAYRVLLRIPVVACIKYVVLRFSKKKGMKRIFFFFFLWGGGEGERRGAKRCTVLCLMVKIFVFGHLMTII